MKNIFAVILRNNTVYFRFRCIVVDFLPKKNKPIVPGFLGSLTPKIFLACGCFSLKIAVSKIVRLHCCTSSDSSELDEAS